MALTQVDQGLLGTYAQYTGFKNRIINGAQVIDQRNAGAVVTPASETVTFITDRFYFIRSITTSPTLQQSTDAPAGFTNSLLFTNANTGATPTYAQVVHNIEGFNTADLGWGTANAQTITVSFRVKSSLTGTFSVAFRNSANNRSYVTTYAISAANTWETKTVTIPGDTSGTWLTNNGIGISLIYRIGGTGGTSSTNQWTATSDAFASGSVNVMGTANATWQITGVQLEKGSTATSFDYRPFGTEVSLCQRYYEKSYNLDVVPGTSGAAGGTGMGGSNTGTTTGFLGTSFVSYKVTKRVAGTITGWDNAGAIGKASRYQLGVSGSNNQNWTLSSSGTQSFQVYSSGSSSDTGFTYSWSCDAEL
jgi:hypothetical protein